MGQPRLRWEQVPSTALVKDKKPRMTTPMELLLGYLAGCSWGQQARTAATWRALQDRGLTSLEGAPPRLALTDKGRRIVARLNAKMTSNG